MKARLDKTMVDLGLAETRTKAAALIMAGRVLVEGRAVTKAGTPVDGQAAISIKETDEFVGRGAHKLLCALDAFSIDVTGMAAIDVGASTGGFTEVLLKRGARLVYAVDVGHGQLDWKLRSDKRVINLEGINARSLDPGLIHDLCDIATFDVSFISLKLVIPPVLKVLKPFSDIIALIKPQFEAGKEHVGKGGIMKDLHVAQEIIHDMEEFLLSLNCEVLGTIPSPVKGMKGNQEYLVHASYRG